VVPLFLTAVVQSGIIVGMLSMTGLFSELRQNALNTLEERTQNKHQNLQTDMGVNWSSLAVNEQRINDAVANLLGQQGETYASVALDAKLNARIVATAAPELVTLIRSNDVTGVFLVRTALRRRRTPTATRAFTCATATWTSMKRTTRSDNVRGPQTVATALGIDTGEHWQETFTFDGGSENAANDYFYKPLEAADTAADVQRTGQTPRCRNSLDGSARTCAAGRRTRRSAIDIVGGAAGANPGSGTADGYWSLPFRLSESEAEDIITYSEPLVARDGTVYGVLGVEIAGVAA
jgi:hypothetical protein